MEWYAEEGKRVYGDIVPPTINDRRILLLKQPVGVAALIVPVNIIMFILYILLFSSGISL